MLPSNLAQDRIKFSTVHFPSLKNAPLGEDLQTYCFCLAYHGLERVWLGASPYLAEAHSRPACRDPLFREDDRGMSPLWAKSGLLLYPVRAGLVHKKGGVPVPQLRRSNPEEHDSPVTLTAEIERHPKNSYAGAVARVRIPRWTDALLEQRYWRQPPCP